MSQEPATNVPVRRLHPVDATSEGTYLATESDGEEVRLLDYLRIVQRYKWSILGIVIIAALVGCYKALSAVPIYRADVKLLVKFNQPKFASYQQFENSPNFWQFYETQYAIIRSRAVGERAVDLLGLDPSTAGDRPVGAAPAVPAQNDQDDSSKVGTMVDDAKSWVDSLRDHVPEEWRGERQAPPSPTSRRDALVSSVMGGLSLSGGKESEIIVIHYDSPSPAKASEYAMAIAQAYIDFGLESRLTNVDQAATYYNERLATLRDKMTQSEAELRRYRDAESMVDTQNMERIVNARLAGLTGELLQAQARRRAAEVQYRQARALKDGNASKESLLKTVDSMLVLEWHQRVLDEQSRVAELSNRYGEKHPKMIAARADLRDAANRLDVALEKEINKSITIARQEYEGAAEQERSLKKLIEEQQEEMRGLSGKAFRLKQLERELDANRQLYESILARSKEADIARDEDATNVRILDPARVPSTPIRPDKQKIILTAVGFGLILGIALALFREHLDRTFRTSQHIEDKLRLPVLGVVPKSKAIRKKGARIEREVLLNPQSQFAESVNDVRTGISFFGVDRPPQVVLVTSSVAGEGKTTLASNLALGFRQRGRTLLLEADLRKGQLSDIAGGRSHCGLTDFVAGQCGLEEALIPDRKAKDLYVMTAGTTPPNPLEILASNRFRAGLAKLREAFSTIVIDAAPLLPVSDSVVLSRLADCVVFVVQADRTNHQMAQDAVKRLLAAHIQPSGAVLQQVDFKNLRGYGRAYGYGAYHGYYRTAK